MARPKSMSDFSSLLDQHTPLGKGYGVERPRKKPSISLAAGLIMNADTNASRSIPPTPQHRPISPPRHDARGYSENLFYAYVQKSAVTPSPPYIFTFSSAAICAQWWDLVRAEYPYCTRAGPQLFILKGDDMQDQIQDNPRFSHLHDKWFYTASDGTRATAIIPLQDYYGNPIGRASRLSSSQIGSQPDSIIKEENEEPKPPTFDLGTLTNTLEKMNSMINDNSNAIQALFHAQSSGLQSMQAINESNSTQIKSLTDNQAKLQALIDQNASHYIALSNSSFQNHDAVKNTLSATAEQLGTLSTNQIQLTKTCQSMMSSIESVSRNISGLGDGVRALSTQSKDRPRSMSDVSTTSSVGTAPHSVSGNRISPAPRKLNRKIRGVWYEYDSALIDTSDKRSRTVTSSTGARRTT